MKIGQPEWQWTLAAVRVQTSSHDADSEHEIANSLVTGDAALGDSSGERRFASAIGSLVWVACLNGQTPTMLPPWQLLLVAVAQSTGCCSETPTNLAETSCQTPSVLPVVENAQQDPLLPYAW